MKTKDLEHITKVRKIIVNITIEYMQKLLEKQDYKCALSGLPIRGSQNIAKRCRSYQEMTASLDRIDSSKDYTEDNIQWVHKEINRLKNNFTEDRLLYLCKIIVNHNKQSKIKKVIKIK